MIFGGADEPLVLRMNDVIIDSRRLDKMKAVIEAAKGIATKLEVCTCISCEGQCSGCSDRDKKVIEALAALESFHC